jgi:hypothetical protein
MCGELYLFGKSLVTREAEFFRSKNDQKILKVNWAENMRRCCSMGMVPMSFETPEQFRCMFEIITCTYNFKLLQV